MKKMKIRIGRDGKVSISVEGGQGPDCVEFTKAVEQAAGVVEKRTFTEDYHRDVVAVGISEDVTESEKL
jgi:hypothetical protein